MPLYEYECNNCGHRFERIQKFSDDLVSVCPLCDGKVRKLVSSPAIQFKGTGWYVTDYARKGAKDESASSESGQTTDSAGTNSDGQTAKRVDSKGASESKKASATASTGTAKAPDT